MVGSRYEKHFLLLISMVCYLRPVTKFPLPARIANTLIRFLLATPVHAARIGHTLVTPKKHKILDSLGFKSCVCIPVFCVLCFVFCILYFVFYVLCFMFYILCFMFYVLCFMFYVLCLVFYDLCSKNNNQEINPRTKVQKF